MWKRFLQSDVSFSSVNFLFFKFFESIKFQGESVLEKESSLSC